MEASILAFDFHPKRSSSWLAFIGHDPDHPKRSLQLLQQAVWGIRALGMRGLQPIPSHGQCLWLALLDSLHQVIPLRSPFAGFCNHGPCPHGTQRPAFWGGGIVNVSDHQHWCRDVFEQGQKCPMPPWTFQHAAILHLDPISCWGERWCIGLWMLKSKRHLGCRLDSQRGQMALDLFLKGRLNREPQMRLLKELGPCMNMGLKCGDCFRSSILC